MLLNEEMKKIYLCMFLAIFVALPFPGTAQVNPKLKQYLSHHNFLELISRFGRDSVYLTMAGQAPERSDSTAYVDGYRCQVFAGGDLQQAQRITEALNSKINAKVYIVESADSLFKVQVGNYTDRRQAENMLLKLWKLGYQGSWLVQMKIVPQENAAKPVAPVAPATTVQPDFYYGVQVFASSSADRARSLSQSLKSKLNAKIRLIEGDGLWKVVLGRFPKREAAEELRNRLRRSGFQDAWITQTN